MRHSVQGCRVQNGCMKKLIVLIAVAAAGYFAYGEWFGTGKGVYADDGRARTVFFATSKCGETCNRMRRFLKKRTEFEEYDAFDLGKGSKLYNELGGNGYVPYIAIGKQRVTGHNPGAVISAMAIEHGLDSIRDKERKALGRHFSRGGKPIVVMYATDWCGYCRKAREYFVRNRIAFVEFDIEKDHSARRDYNALMGSGTPLLYQGYTRVSGFDVARIESDFDL